MYWLPSAIDRHATLLNCVHEYSDPMRWGVGLYWSPAAQGFEDACLHLARGLGSDCENTRLVRYCGDVARWKSDGQIP